MIGVKCGTKTVIWETTDTRVTIYHYSSVYGKIIPHEINGILIEKRKWVEVDECQH